MASDLDGWEPKDGDELVTEYGRAKVEIWTDGDRRWAIDKEHSHIIYKAKNDEEFEKLKIHVEGYVDGKMTEQYNS